MPNPCDEHGSKPQISCEVCFPNELLESNIRRLQETKIPSAPMGSAPRKKPRRLDDAPDKPRKETWRDKLGL